RNVPSMFERFRFDKQHETFLVGDRVMPYASGDGEHLTLIEGDCFRFHFDSQASLQNVEHLVVIGMRMPDKVALEFRDLYVGVADFHYNTRRTIIIQIGGYCFRGRNLTGHGTILSKLL